MATNNDLSAGNGENHSHREQCSQLFDIAMSAEQRGDLIGAELCYKQLLDRHKAQGAKCLTYLVQSFTHLLELLERQGREDEIAALLDQHHDLVKSVATALIHQDRFREAGQ